MERLTRPHLILLTSVLILAMPMALHAQSQIDFVDGEVWIERNGQRLEADFGSPVEEGDLVITGDGSTAIVSVSEGTQIKLRENSTVEVGPENAANTVDLRRGGLFARVQGISARENGFQVTTPTTVAGVRGTQFFIAYGRTVEERPDVWVCVNEGEVEVRLTRTGFRTLVTEGEGINLLNGTRTRGARFFDWTEELNWNFDPDAGTVRDTTDLDGAYSDLLDQDYD